MFVLPQAPFPQSSFDSNPFMHKQANGVSNGFSDPFQKPLPPQGTLYRPVKPRGRRKRKISETDLEEVNPLKPIVSGLSLRNPSSSKLSHDQHDRDSVSLQFMKQSNKRKRTNQMELSQDQIHVDSKLEHNIYSHSASRSVPTSPNRQQTPYVQHPYHLSKSLSGSPELKSGSNRSSNSNSKSSLNSSLKSEDEDHSMNLSGFQLRNSENEGVSKWKESIESQLMSARNESVLSVHSPSQIEELCQRICNTSGLGRAVLMAKLRKQLPVEVFQRVCRMVESSQRSQSI